MRPGAIALIDCLGFKGVWTKHDPEVVLEKLRRLQQGVMQHQMAGNQVIAKPLSDRGLMIKTASRFLSDTVCLACWYDGPKEIGWDYSDKLKAEEMWPAVVIVAKMAAHLLKGSALVEPPLSMRGCISAGWFKIDRNFIIGPAVDEAAELMNIAEGAFTWVTPSAADCIGAANRHWKTKQKNSNSSADRDLSYEMSLFLSSYDMPIKGGLYLSTPLLNPLVGDPPSMQAEIVENMLASFDSKKIEVLVKKQNTKRFLDACVSTT